MNFVEKEQIRFLFQEQAKGREYPEGLRDEDVEKVTRFHKSIPGYQPTPLLELAELSRAYGVKGIFVKDESQRFGLNAFKGLGGTYAMFRIICRELGLDPEKTSFEDLQTRQIREKTAKLAFVTATDGNHGKGVSWASSLFGCKAYVFMPAGSSERRAEAIRQAGPAAVTITDMNYDETVQYAKKVSEEKQGFLIQDTAWDGYEEIPLWIIQGYLTMAWEAVRELESKGIVPTHVFLQAGVGAMAGGVTGYLMNHFQGKEPAVTIVEPDTVDCIFRSAKNSDGKIHSVEGDPVTIMAGLNCGTPCKITWPILRDFPVSYAACSDAVAAHGMRIYAQPKGTDPQIVSGESGAATMGALSYILDSQSLREIHGDLGLNENAVILLINTEGDTDPDSYRAIVRGNAHPFSWKN